MSWFKRSPKVKEPHKQTPHRSSPAAQKMLENAKKSFQEKIKDPKNHK